MDKTNYKATLHSALTGVITGKQQNYLINSTTAKSKQFLSLSDNNNKSKLVWRVEYVLSLDLRLQKNSFKKLTFN